jgi:hypothetical protein
MTTAMAALFADIRIRVFFSMFMSELSLLCGVCRECDRIALQNGSGIREESLKGLIARQSARPAEMG